MTLKVALQMDPIGSVNINADSTFRIALEAQARGHEVFFYTPDKLAFVEGRVIARDGAEVIFIEVKQSSTHALAAEHLSARQMARIYASASEFLSSEPAGQMTESRFDVALVNAAGQIEILENAFAA